MDTMHDIVEESLETLVGFDQEGFVSFLKYQTQYPLWFVETIYKENTPTFLEGRATFEERHKHEYLEAKYQAMKAKKSDAMEVWG